MEIAMKRGCCLLQGVNWQESIKQWRRLPDEEQRRIWWALIPRRVAESMAYEGEPVELEWLEKLHREPIPSSFSKPVVESRIARN